MTELRPPALDEHGLALALQDLGNAFARRTRVSCQMSVSISERLDPSTETVLYRVVQEALANVGKHASATSVTVTLTDATPDGSAVMTVVDDGVGFDTAQTAAFVARGHFGLAGMRERVELAAGEYRLTSSPGAGTQILVRMPGQRRAAA
jgi:two-component system NarL family sensor kinase